MRKIDKLSIAKRDLTEDFAEVRKATTILRRNLKEAKDKTGLDERGTSLFRKIKKLDKAYHSIQKANTLAKLEKASATFTILLTEVTEDIDEIRTTIVA